MSSQKAPTSLWFQAFRDGASFGLKDSSGRVVDDDIYESGLHLEPIGSFTLMGSEGMVLYLPYCGPPYIHLDQTTSEFDMHWEPKCLIISSRDTSTVVPLSSVRPDENNHLYLGEAFTFETAKVERRMKVNYPGREGLFTAYHDITYTVQFIRRPGTTFTPDHSLASRSPSPDHSLMRGNDIALLFPFESQMRPPVLWTAKQTLMQASSYYEAMFTGGYSEAKNVLPETSRMLGDTNTELAKIMEGEREGCQLEDTASDDSDAEDAEGNNKDGDQESEKDGEMAIEKKEETSSQPFGSPNMHYVIIKHAHYKTYKALLHWLESDEIQFSCLRSLAKHSPNPYASPKSIYKLAHHLGIEKLEKIAASNFESQLSPSIVLKELFSPTCFAHMALREAAYNALEKQWEEVKDAGGLDDLLTLIQADNADLKEMMLVAVEILRRADKLGKGREDS